MRRPATITHDSAVFKLTMTAIRPPLSQSARARPASWSDVSRISANACASTATSRLDLRSLQKMEANKRAYEGPLLDEAGRINDEIVRLWTEAGT